MTSKPRPPLPAGPYLVVGLARSGVAAARALRAQGQDVVAVDAGEPAGAAELRAEGVAVHTGTDAREHLEHARAVVKSPGVPREAPVVAAARERGIAVMGELELAWRLVPNPFIAVTGTNGKTTTAELVGHIHRVAALPYVVVGNVGTAASTLAGTLGADAVVVCEASSFQLEDALEFSPDTAVLLNVTPDHLDRHGTFDDYLAAKLRIFARQGNDDVAVAPTHLGVEDIGGCARRVLFGAGPDAELAERAGHLWWTDEALLAVSEIRLRGAHNLFNAMAAAAACLARGVDPDAVREGLRTFGGVEHRLEEVAEHDGVLYVNDSKATNVDSTLVALAAFDAPVHLILGGRGGGQDFSALRGAVAGRVASVELIGEDAEAIAAALDGIRPPRFQCADLERALACARSQARPGHVVLLSPACKSFDQYPDFEARGAHFKELVSGLT